VGSHRRSLPLRASRGYAAAVRQRRDTGARGTAWLLVLAQAAFLVLLAAAHRGLTATFNPGWGYDVFMFQQFSLSLLHGSLPYIGFAFEYPPLALVPMMAPHLLGIQVDAAAYEFRYVLFGALLSTVVAVTLLGIVALHRPRLRATRVLATYLLLLIPAALIALWRYDLFPATLTLVALFAVLRGNAAVGGLCLGVAIAAKLYPIVLLPILAAYLLVPGRTREAATFIGVAAAAAIVPLLPGLAIDPTATLSFVRYQVERPLEIETLPGGVLRLAGLIGLMPRPERLNAFSSENIVSPEASAALAILPIVALALLAFVTICAFLRFREEHDARGRINTGTLVSFCVLALLAFLATAKVLSPQYIVWLLPFAALLPPRQALVFAAMFALTFVVYPGSWNQFIEYDPLPLIALNVRNLLLVGLLVALLVELAPSFRRQPVLSEAT
jgi:uncharacterized membrane protein